MTLSELLGIIKLSYKQAEGRQMNIAILCLQSILFLSLPAAVPLVFLIARKEHTGFAMAAVAFSALMAVCLRGTLVRRMFLLSEGFLREGKADSLPAPDMVALLSGELVYLAVVCTVTVFFMLPAVVCLRFGIKYYSLSGDQSGLMLLTSSALLFAAGGIIFAAVVKARLGCAEYLWLKRKCPDMLSALDCSWELTRGSGGDLLRLRLISLLSAPGIPFLCGMNLSHRLLRSKGLPSSEGLRLETFRDVWGEERIELT